MVDFKGRKFALDGHVPLKFRQWEELEVKYGISPERLGTLSWAHLATLVWYVLNLVDSEVTLDDVKDTLAPGDEIVKAVAEAVGGPISPKPASS